MDKQVKTVLLVEDEAIIAFIESNILKDNGYNVITALNGDKAIEHIRKNPSIDLILMDIDLGKGMDGTEVAQEILKTHNIPVVFLSSHEEKEIVEKTDKITSYGYIVKHSGETVLLASIKMAFKLFEANLKLKESEENYRTLVEASPEGIAVHSGGKLIFLNPQAVKIMGGNSPEDFIGKPLIDLVHPDFHEIVKNRVKAIYDQNKAFQFIEEKFIRLDGKEIDVEVMAASITYMGKPASQVIFRCISERER